MAIITRAQVIDRGTRRRKVVPSEVFGGEFCIQELSRWDVNMATRVATIPTDPDKIYTHLWRAAQFAFGVIDPTDGKPLFTFDEVSDFREDPVMWAEIDRVVDLIRELSEVGPESLKSGDPAPDAG